MFVLFILNKNNKVLFRFLNNKYKLFSLICNKSILNKILNIEVIM